MAKKKKEKIVTSPTARMAILSDFWLNCRNDEEFEDFIEYNDLGLPLAHAISSGMVEVTPMAMTFIDETFELLLDVLDIEDDGFEDLDDLLGRAVND